MKINSKLLIGCLVFLLAISCNEDGELINPFKGAKAIDIITGLVFKDANGQLVGTVGNPNIKSGSTLLFPNPANNVLSIQSNQQIEQLWFLRANKNTNFEDVNFSEAFESEEFNPSELESKSELSVTKTGMNISVSTSLLSSDYYRVFFLLEDSSIVWDNLYIDRVNPFEKSIDLLIQDWNE